MDIVLQAQVKLMHILKMKKSANTAAQVVMDIAQMAPAKSIDTVMAQISVSGVDPRPLGIAGIAQIKFTKNR
jgi:hypothetical protein